MAWWWKKKDEDWVSERERMRDGSGLVGRSTAGIPGVWQGVDQGEGQG